MTQGWRMRGGGGSRRRPILAVGLAFAVLLAGAAGTLAVLPGVALPWRGVDETKAASASGVPTASAAASLAPTSPIPSSSVLASPSPSPSPSPDPSPSPAWSWLGPGAGQQVDPALGAKLQQALDKVRRQLGSPGIEATVILPDGSSWTGVGGLAVVKSKQAVTPSTPFVYASVTKTFTAALICRLADEGRLHLDDRLSSWLPDVPGSKKITIRQLLDHQSGLADFFTNLKLNRILQQTPTAVWTPQQVLPYLPPAWFAPGGGWGYSNTNYLLLGLVAERAGGAPWATQIHREFLAPLGLDSIYVQGVDSPTAGPAHAYQVRVNASGGLVYKDFSDGSGIIPFTSVTTATFAAGTLAGDSQDLATWGALLYSGKVLSPAMTAEMLKMAKVTNRTPSESYGVTVYYGLGVSRVKLAGRWTAVGHTGALDGTRASIRWLPKERVAIAAFYNRDGDLLTGDLVADALLPVLYPAKPAATPSASPKH